MAAAPVRERIDVLDDATCRGGLEAHATSEKALKREEDIPSIRSWDTRWNRLYLGMLSTLSTSR
jgi:hypothetical protein